MMQQGTREKDHDQRKSVYPECEVFHCFVCDVVVIHSEHDKNVQVEQVSPGWHPHHHSRHHDGECGQQRQHGEIHGVQK
jgi:hypothetical protein